MTIRFALFVVALCAAAPGLAEGPGTRIRSGSDMPRLLDSLQRTESGPCGRLRGEAKHRCLEAARKPAGSDRAPGPEATGMRSSGGSASSTGASGAPR